MGDRVARLHVVPLIKSMVQLPKFRTLTFYVTNDFIHFRKDVCIYFLLMFCIRSHRCNVQPWMEPICLYNWLFTWSCRNNDFRLFYYFPRSRTNYYFYLKLFA